MTEHEKLQKKYEQLGKENERLRTEIIELQGFKYMHAHDVKALGQDNLGLLNTLNAARAEIARLKAPKKRGRPRKDIAGSYEDYLYRETTELINRSRKGPLFKATITNKAAAIEADKRIRKTALSLQAADMSGAFFGLAANYPATEDSIYKAFKRAKKAREPTKPKEIK